MYDGTEVADGVKAEVVCPEQRARDGNEAGGALEPAEGRERPRHMPLKKKSGGGLLLPVTSTTSST